MSEEKFDLVLTGLQSDDQGHAQMGVILAERLGIPHSTIIMEVQVENDRVRVKRELEGGWFQWIAMPLPALLTIQSGINQLRYATLKGIMAAKKKEIKKVTLPAGLKPAQEILSLSLPVRSKQTHMIDGSPAEAAKDLVRRLREEARVL
jgi:electron transfer flavoprotein beta subunit